MKAIRTKYIEPTNTRGSRIMATDDDGNRVFVPYPHELSGEACHRVAALALCQRMKWFGRLIGGGLGNGYVFVWDTGDGFDVVGDTLTRHRSKAPAR